jgi:hypothetical protein
MARTIPQVITEVRKLLKDTRTTSLRTSDEYLIGVLNSAFTEMQRLRPDIFYAGCDTEELELFETADAQDSAAAFPVEDQFFMPVVWYIVAIVELADDEFTLEGRAQAFMQSFRQALIGVGG